MMLHHIAAKSPTNREAMSDLVALCSFILKQEFVPLGPEQLDLQRQVARSGVSVASPYTSLHADVVVSVQCYGSRRCLFR